MPTKKPAKRLTPIPTPHIRTPKPGKEPADPAAPPDLSWIAEGLHPLAVPIGSIDFDPANARKHDEANLSAIRASLRVYGQRKPIVVNRRTSTVLAGNGTLAGALALSRSHIAVVFVDDDPTTAAGYSISDNRSSELASWDTEALDALLRTVQTDDSDLADLFSQLAVAEKLIPAEEKLPPATPPSTIVRTPDGAEPAGDEDRPAAVVVTPAVDSEGGNGPAMYRMEVAIADRARLEEERGRLELAGFRCGLTQAS